MSTFKSVLLAASTSLLAFSTFAADPSQVEKKFELKDGSTMYVFKDGKMGMEDKFGRPGQHEGRRGHGNEGRRETHDERK
ncbi:CopK family periplasmic copper-binding protein [Cupriavidus basilensis]